MISRIWSWLRWSACVYVEIIVSRVARDVGQVRVVDAFGAEVADA
jgi:hypothetical protein